MTRIVILFSFIRVLFAVSTGITGRSCLQIVHPDTGEIIKRVYIDKTLFGEGITVINDKVFMLTWKNMKMLVYDSQSLQVLDACLSLVLICY